MYAVKTNCSKAVLEILHAALSTSTPLPVRTTCTQPLLVRAKHLKQMSPNAYYTLYDVITRLSPMERAISYYKVHVELLSDPSKVWL